MPCIALVRLRAGDDLYLPGCPLDLSPDAADRMIAAGKVRRDDAMIRWRRKNIPVDR